MMNYKRVEGQSKLMKDPVTGVIVNSDDDEIEMARMRKLATKEKKEKERELSDKVDRISNDLDRLTSMFEKILEKEYGNRNQ